MKPKLLTLLTITILFTACGQKNETKTARSAISESVIISEEAYALYLVNGKEYLSAPPINQRKSMPDAKTILEVIQRGQADAKNAMLKLHPPSSPDRTYDALHKYYVDSCTLHGIARNLDLETKDEEWSKTEEDIRKSEASLRVLLP